jgi:hypothetical protein
LIQLNVFAVFLDAVFNSVLDVFRVVGVSRTYIEIVPSKDRLEPTNVLEQLAAFSEIWSPELIDKLPFTGSKPTFEFTIIKRKEDDHVRFLVGVKNTTREETQDIYGKLQANISAMYPDTFEIERITADMVDIYGDDGGLLDQGDNSADIDDLSNADLPHTLRWKGVGSRKKDWMTPLKGFDMRGGPEVTTRAAHGYRCRHRRCVRLPDHFQRDGRLVEEGREAQRRTQEEPRRLP